MEYLPQRVSIQSRSSTALHAGEKVAGSMPRVRNHEDETQLFMQ